MTPHPFSTACFPGTGGVLKERPGDFLVEETPLYEPAGTGEHLFLFIEKTGLSTDEALRLAGRAFGVGRGAMGVAGQKDKQAVTRQWISIHLPGVRDSVAAQGIEAFGADPEQVRVLRAGRHANKLRLGHHAGNRFVIKVRQVTPLAAVRARPVLEWLAINGAPDFVGTQRFGRDGDGAEMGRQLLTGMAPPEVARLPRERRAFFLSAFQSEIFNRVLARRVQDGTWNRLLPGDLAMKHDNGSLFAVDEALAQVENGEGGRIASVDISPSGPLWGDSMLQGAGVVGELEKEVLAESGFTPETYAAACTRIGGDNTHGARRPLRIPVRETALSFSVDEHGPFLQVAFLLPKGAFATEVLREIMK